MNVAHLSAEEIDLVLAGEGLPAERAAHLAGCVACRRRRDEVLATIAATRVADPAPAARARLRAAALADMPHAHSLTRWWLAAAAALVLVVLAAVFVVPAMRPRPVDTDAVLLQVDEVLARDPLAAMADEDVVQVVVSDAAAGRGSAT